MSESTSPFGLTSGQLEELAQVMRGMEEWASVRQAIVDAFQRTGDQQAMVLAGREALAKVGLDGVSILANVPTQFAGLTDDLRAKAAEMLDLYMVASVAQELATGEPLPVMPLAGGHVTVEWVENGDVRMPIVHAYVTPLGDPRQIAELLLDTCYGVFPSDTFAKRVSGARDAEWWTRWKRGDTYREIALSDERSPLAPEARANPSEYADEIVTATDAVRRAVKRFDKRWTQNLDSLSKPKD